MFDLTGFQRDCLFIINGLDDPKGLEVKEKLEEYYNKEIHHGRLYPNLDDLVEQGFVNKGSLDKRTNFYEVTEEGEKLIEERLEWEKKRAG